MPSSPLAHICLLVRDLDVAVNDWRGILAVLDPAQLEQPIVRYDEFEGGEDRMRWATFVTDQGTEIQLLEPAPDTPLGRRLERHGEHVHHICFTTSDVSATATQLAEAGFDVDADRSYSDPSIPWQRWTWLRPTSTHGVMVEIARPYKALDGRWVDGEV